MLAIVAVLIGGILLYIEVLLLCRKNKKNGVQRNIVAEITFFVATPVSVVMLVLLYYLPFLLIALQN